MANLLMAQLVCSAIETVANKALSLSEPPVNFSDNYQGKSLMLNLAELGFCLQFVMVGSRLLVTSPNHGNTHTNAMTNALTNAGSHAPTDESSNADCTISTSLSTLNKISSEHQLTELIKNEELDIVGNIKVAQQFATLAERIDIDWPKAIEAQIGDIATYKLLSLGQKVAAKVNFAKTQISEDATEYLLHEQRLLVAAGELSRFSAQVADNQKAADQLAERISAIGQRISELSHQ